tara:strand:+ start:791 stop:919 length:129 start_codon:yes stop_codon:yes gene_type:complete
MNSPFIYSHFSGVINIKIDPNHAKKNVKIHQQIQGKKTIKNG